MAETTRDVEDEMDALEITVRDYCREALEKVWDNPDATLADVRITADHLADDLLGDFAAELERRAAALRKAEAVLHDFENAPCLSDLLGDEVEYCGCFGCAVRRYFAATGGDRDKDFVPTEKARFCNQAGPMGGGCKDSWHVGGNYGSSVCRNPNHHDTTKELDAVERYNNTREREEE